MSLSNRVETLKAAIAGQGLDNPTHVVMGNKEREELAELARSMSVNRNADHHGPETFLGLIVTPVYQRTCLMVGTVAYEE